MSDFIINLIKCSADFVRSIFRLLTGIFQSSNMIQGVEDQIDAKVREICKVWKLDNPTLIEYMKRLEENIDRGLNKETHDAAIVKSFVTYVTDLPTGEEEGQFLALDLGGTNFRVLLITLTPGHFEMLNDTFAIPEYIMIGPGEQLFDHIAKCLADFVHKHNLSHLTLPLGFTFSFPLQQLGLTKGILARWTKGFNCSGVVGENVVQLLDEAIERRGDVKIDVCAVLNDTTGTLMSCAWKNPSCRVGLIVGTGSNACFVEKVERAQMYAGSSDEITHVIINTEWGAFGDDGQLDNIRNEFDKDIDTNSINIGKQLHEKMISGMYMGELARQTILKCVKENLMFGGRLSDKLKVRDSFKTKYVSEIESERLGDYTKCRKILTEELNIENVTDQDCVNTRYICQCVSTRAAHMVGAGLVMLIKRINEPKITIGIDGSVYRYHPHFHNLICQKIDEFLPSHLKYTVMLSEDGSGRGAALVAAVASKNLHGERDHK